MSNADQTNAMQINKNAKFNSALRGLFGSVLGVISLLIGLLIAFMTYPDRGMAAGLESFWLFGVGVYLVVLGGLFLLSPHKKWVWNTVLVLLIPVLLAVIVGTCFIVFMIYSLFHGGYCNPHC